MRVEPQELRIGNKLNRHFEGGPGEEIDCTIRDIFDVQRSVLEKDFKFSFSGIPLTEEWLLKFGCKNLGTCHWETPNGIQFNFHQENNCGVICFGPRHVNFWHVHTFQNIIALTGTEL